MATADLSNFYHSMPAANNHHLKDKHADRYSDPHTAFLKGHEAVCVSVCVCVCVCVCVGCDITCLRPTRTEKTLRKALSGLGFRVWGCRLGLGLGLRV